MSLARYTLSGLSLILIVLLGGNHFLIAMKSGCANHLAEIATLGNSVGLIGMCIPSLPVIKILF